MDGGDSRDRDRDRDTRSASSSFREGDKVEARFKGKARWFKGTVEAANRDGTYDIRYEDGDRERDVVAEYVRKLDGSGSRDSRDRDDRDSGARRGRRAPSPVPIREGDTVEARFRGKMKWFKGTVESVNRDGTFDIRYDDGDRERDVVEAFVRPMDSGATRGGSSPRTPGRHVAQRPNTGGSSGLVSSRPSPSRKLRRNSLSTVNERDATPSLRRPNLSVRTNKTPRVRRNSLD